MKKLIVLAFIFCGCFTQVVTTPDEPKHDYIGVTIVHPLWYWGLRPQYTFEKHPNRRELAIEKRTGRLYMGPRTHRFQPLPPASRTRK
jgi:hypothetical protein